MWSWYLARASAGEVTLTGRILPIGGVKEKALAARRAGVTTILFPEANRADYDELSGARVRPRVSSVERACVGLHRVQ